tara:strand:- start:82 stop:450 length:369 start_codon:yes stop_codon:yes gene_type:complete
MLITVSDNSNYRAARFNWVTDMNNYRAGHIYVRVSSIATGAANHAAAWYFYRCSGYNRGLTASLIDSGGSTGSFTVTLSDQGDLDSDSCSLQVAATGPSGNASINVECFATNYMGIREAWRA